MAAESDATSPRPHAQFLEVYTADGLHRRFAAGTKAAFAVDRINKTAVQTGKRYSLIECAKEGEEAVEFGPDAELVTYGEGWKLYAVQDAEVLKFEAAGFSKSEVKDKTKGITQLGQKVFDAADLYPGGVLPDNSRPENYVLNLVLLVLIIFGVGGACVFLLENQFFMFS